MLANGGEITKQKTTRYQFTVHLNTHSHAPLNNKKTRLASICNKLRVLKEQDPYFPIQTEYQPQYSHSVYLVTEHMPFLLSVVQYQCIHRHQINNLNQFNKLYQFTLFHKC